jgi:dihydrofolate synthase/folylpolyglutamate synthase
VSAVGARTLPGWLEFIGRQHPDAIALGLDRVRAVMARMGIAIGCPVFTVAGTNGKGSVCATLESILRVSGRRVGLYTSPHLLRYNERIRVHGREVTDDALLAAFAEIDAARGDISLTFFEWNTLAALLVFVRARVDVAVLEVGLGGRLDAVNILDPDTAAVVSVGIDHREYLGNTIDAIGAEKAGIFRSGRPAIFGGRTMPKSVAAHAAKVGARLWRIGTDFDYVERADGWDYVGFGSRRRELPLPALAGASQLGNAAVAVAMLEATEPKILVPDTAVSAGLAKVALPGRFQVMAGEPEWILDVAHNAQAAQSLAASLAARPGRGRTIAVCGILGDKDVEAIVAVLAPQVGHWIAVGLEGSRALAPSELARRIECAGCAFVLAATDVAAGMAAARSEAGPFDRVVVFGSFLTVGPALAWLGAAH